MNNISPICRDARSGGVPTLSHRVIFLVFCWPTFVSLPETKAENRFLRCMIIRIGLCKYHVITVLLTLFLHSMPRGTKLQKVSVSSIVWRTRCIAGIIRRRVFVCLSVCLSITRRYYTKTANRRITQTTPRDSLGTLVITYEHSFMAFL